MCAAGAFQARVLSADEQALARDLTRAWPATPGLVELDCVVRRVEAVGDHDLVLAEVAEVRLGRGQPAVYWRRGFFEARREYPWLATAATFHAFIAAWEQGSLPKASWTHAAHVAVAACYRVRHGDAALARTREGIRRYNTAVGTANTDTSGYHETLTRFWATVIGAAVSGIDDDWAAARDAVEWFGEDRDLHTLYYGFDVVRSVIARRTWVPPDVHGLPTPVAPATAATS